MASIRVVRISRGTVGHNVSVQRFQQFQGAKHRHLDSQRLLAALLWRGGSTPS